MTYAAIVLETRISCRHVTWSWWNRRKKDVPAFSAMKTFKILLGCCQPRGGWICMALIQLQGGCEDERYGSHVKASSPLGWRDGSQCDGRILDRILWRVEGVKDDISLWPMMIWSAVVLLYGCWWWIFGCFQLQRFDKQATKTNKQALPHLSPCTSFQSLEDGYLLYLVVPSSSQDEQPDGTRNWTSGHILDASAWKISHLVSYPTYDVLLTDGSKIKASFDKIRRRFDQDQLVEVYMGRTFGWNYGTCANDVVEDWGGGSETSEVQTMQVVLVRDELAVTVPTFLVRSRPAITAKIWELRHGESEARNQNTKSIVHTHKFWSSC